MTSEFATASTISQIACTLAPSEVSANKYARQTFELYGPTISSSLQDQNQLQQDWDNSWGLYQELSKKLLYEELLELLRKLKIFKKSN